VRPTRLAAGRERPLGCQAGDIDGASFRFQVGEEEWSGDLRTVRSVKALHDVTVATYGAYPDASVELRTRPTTTSTTKEDDMSDSTSPVPAEEARPEDKSEERQAPETKVVNEPAPRAGSRGPIRPRAVHVAE
jgi:Caudovirus prohead serine protease